MFITPFILWFKLAPCSLAIVEFYHANTHRQPGRGDICAFASFDFENGVTPAVSPLSPLPRGAGPSLGFAAGVSAGAGAGAGFDFVAMPDEQPVLNSARKMEHSMINFKTQHPTWIPPPSSVNFLEELGQSDSRADAAHAQIGQPAATGYSESSIKVGIGPSNYSRSVFFVFFLCFIAC